MVHRSTSPTRYIHTGRMSYRVSRWRRHLVLQVELEEQVRDAGFIPYPCPPRPGDPNPERSVARRALEEEARWHTVRVVVRDATKADIRELARRGRGLDQITPIRRSLK